MSTATQSRTVQLMNAEQLREQQETSGREGLASLIKAVRRMLDWLLLPFRMVGRVLFKPKLVSAATAAETSDGAADRVAALEKATAGEKTGLPGATAADEQELAGLVKQVAGNPDGGLDIEVTGKPDDIDVVLPMLMRHIDQILKTHLPSDAQEAQVASHLVGLAETAERSRYAHRLVSWQVDGAWKAVLADPQYVGLSRSTIEGMIRAAAKSPAAAAEFGDGSAEQRLLARLAVRDKIEADYAMQMRQIAVALAPMMGSAKAGSELVGRGKDLLASALQAADATRHQLRVHHAAKGTVKELRETLPAVQDAIDEAIANVALSVAEKNEVAPTPLAEVGEVLVGDTAEEFVGLSKAEPEAPVMTAVPSIAPVAAAAVAPEQAPAAVPAPKVADAAKAAVTAVQAIRSGGMFGGVATVQRSIAEIEEANVVEDAFDMDDSQNLVGG